MIPEEEFEIDEGTLAEQTVEHFMKNAPKEIDAELEREKVEVLAEYQKLKNMEKSTADALKAMRPKLGRLFGTEQGMSAHGEFAIKIGKHSGNTKVDWEKWSRDVNGDTIVNGFKAEIEQFKQGNITHDFISKGKDSPTYSVSKLKGPGVGEERQ